MTNRFVLRTSLYVFGTLLLLVASTTALLRSSANESHPPVPRLKTKPQGDGGTTVPTLRIFVHPEDIYPDVITIAAGPIQLRAENETLGDVSLVIDQVKEGQLPQTIIQFGTTNKAKRVAQQVDLPAGEYVYYDPSRPDVRGKLIVTGN